MCDELLMFEENTLSDYALDSTGTHALGQCGQNMYEE